MINIAELLKDAPKGMKLYSPLFGEVEYSYVGGTNRRIWVCTKVSMRMFSMYGRYCFTYDEITKESAECLLFPSKDCRTWEGWKVPKPHYDIANFKPFDKVLVRGRDIYKWKADYFSHYAAECMFSCVGSLYKQCIPFEGNEHLLGTTDMPDEEYINW